LAFFSNFVLVMMCSALLAMAREVLDLLERLHQFGVGQHLRESVLIDFNQERGVPPPCKGGSADAGGRPLHDRCRVEL